MRTYALVPADAIMHTSDSIEHVKSVQAEAAEAGSQLILVKPMDTIIDLARAERRKRGGPETKDLWSQIMSSLDSLKAAVAKNTTVVESAVTLLGGIAERLAGAKDDPAAVEALAAEINSEADRLAAAVAMNTPAVKLGEAEPAPAAAPPGDPTTDTPSA